MPLCTLSLATLSVSLPAFMKRIIVHALKGATDGSAAPSMAL